MINICKCCGCQITEIKCSYCGYSNDVITFDDAAEEILKKSIASYKSKLINQIKDISVDRYNYKWNSKMSKLDFLGDEKISIADGTDCLNNIIWSEKVFGQDIDDTSSEKSITVVYTVREKNFSVTVNLKPILCNDFWKIGVEIKEDLMLYVYLGNMSTKTVTGPIALELN